MRDQRSMNPTSTGESRSLATSEKSMTKKEKDIAEVTKLIQKATDTTNNLFENSDHFKFKIKRDKIQSA